MEIMIVPLDSRMSVASFWIACGGEAAALGIITVPPASSTSVEPFGGREGVGAGGCLAMIWVPSASKLSSGAGGGGVGALERLVEAISRKAVSSCGSFGPGGWSGRLERLVDAASRNSVLSSGSLFGLPLAGGLGAGVGPAARCTVSSESRPEGSAEGSGGFTGCLGRLCGSSVITPIHLPAANSHAQGLASNNVRAVQNLLTIKDDPRPLKRKFDQMG